MKYVVRCKTNIHSAIREVFNTGSGDKTVRSHRRKDGDYLIVSSVAVENELAAKKHFSKIEELVNVEVPTQGSNVVISTRICLDSGNNRRTKTKINSEYAFSQFMKRCGLTVCDDGYDVGYVFRVVTNQNITSGGKGVHLFNCFEAKGIFEIIDQEAFKSALENGVYGRGSYGFGALDIIDTSELLEESGEAA